MVIPASWTGILNQWVYQSHVCAFLLYRQMDIKRTINSLQFHINQSFSMGIVFVYGFFGPYDTPVEWPSTVERSLSISVSQEVTSRMASSLLTSQARAETRDGDEDQNSMLRTQSGFTWWNIDEKNSMIWLSYPHWSSIIIRVPIRVIIKVIIIVIIIIVAIIAIIM